MSEKLTGGPAFPVVMSNDRIHPNEHQVSYTEFQTYGISMRDYFAAKAMQAIIAGAMPSGVLAEEEAKNTVCKAAYKVADEMLEARK